MTFDTQIIISLQALLHGSFGQALSVFCARYVIFLFAPLGAWIFYKNTNEIGRHLTKDAVIALLFALAIAAGIGDLINRPRPFIDSTLVVRLIPIPASVASFPSLHASAAFALAGVLALVSAPIAWIAMVIAVLVAFGRVAAGVHYPSDVLAGAIIGLACSALVRYLHAAVRRRDLRRKGEK